MIYFISDTHWWHAKVILYSQRPYSSVEDMNDQLIKNWNRTIKPNDICYHLGDFAFCKYPELKTILRQLNGNINVILGNHDKVIIDNQEDLLQSGLIKSIQTYKEIKYEGQFFVLFHYGMRVWNKSHHNSILCYGHSHGKLPPLGKSVDVGVDCKEITSEYRPISIVEIIKYMKNK